MLTVYGIRGCDNCRKALKYLSAKKIEHRFHDIRSDGLDRRMLERWSERVAWETLVNRRSLTWRRMPDADRGGMTQSRAFTAILNRPTLMKRPVFEGERFFAVGLSVPRFDDFLAGNASADTAGNVIFGQIV